MGTGEENPAQGGPTYPVSRRVPWRAVLLSVAVAGLGELYSGRALRAIVVNVSLLAAGLICLRLLFIPSPHWNIVAPLLAIVSLWVLRIGDAVHCARRAPLDYRLKAYNRWYVYVALTVLVWVGQRSLQGVIRSRFEEAGTLPTESMSPTILKGDDFFVDKRAYVGREPQIGDVVEFRFPTHPSVPFVKRIVAKGGDVLTIRDEKAYIDGKPLDEPFVRPPTQPISLRDDFPPDPAIPAITLVSDGFDPAWVREMPNFIHSDGIHIPPGDFFVMGDNRSDSLDSRYWGFVPRADIVGKVGFVYFSWDAAARQVRWARIGEVVR